MVVVPFRHPRERRIAAELDYSKAHSQQQNIREVARYERRKAQLNFALKELNDIVGPVATLELVGEALDLRIPKPRDYLTQEE